MHSTILAAMLSIASGATIEDNQVAEFDGSRDCITIANSPALRPPSAFTLECWVNGTGANGRLVNFGDGISGNTNRAYDLSFTSGFVGWMFFQQGNGVQLDGPPPANPWAHVAMTFDSGLGLATLIVDGQQVDQETTTGQGAPLQGLTIRGSSYPLVFGMNNNFTAWDLDGQLDRVRIWSRALSASEVRCLTDVRITTSDFPSFPGLVDVWNFQGDVRSESGLHNGTICGNTSLVTAAIPSLFVDVYCPGSPNSVGPGARLSILGSTNVTVNRFALQLTGCPPSTTGHWVVGTGQVQVPFGDGVFCVSGPGLVVFPRSRVDAAGNFTLPADISGIPAGALANVQFLYVDPFGVIGFNASDGAALEFCQ